MLRTIQALHNFLESNGFSTDGVSVTIEFDDITKGHLAWCKVKDELNPMLRYPTPLKREKMTGLKIMDIPVRFLARVPE